MICIGHMDSYIGDGVSNILWLYEFLYNICNQRFSYSDVLMHLSTMFAIALRINLTVYKFPFTMFGFIIGQYL